MLESFYYIYLLCISIFCFIGIFWFVINFFGTIDYIHKEKNNFILLVFSWAIWGTILAMIILSSQS